MKKLFVALAICIAAISCSPLKIAMNSRDSKGERIILTTDQKLCSTIRELTEVALGAKIIKKDTVLAILVTSNRDSDHGVFNKNDLMMIRFDDNSEMSLKNIYDKEFDSSTEIVTDENFRTGLGYAYSYDPLYNDFYVTPYTISGFVPSVRTEKTTNSYALYLVSKAQMKKLCSKNIIKLRIETESDDIEIEGENNISALFAKMYDCLKTAFPNKGNDF